MHGLITFDEWYALESDTPLLEEAIRKYGVINIALAKSPTDLVGETCSPHDAKLINVLYECDCMGCADELGISEDMRLERLMSGQIDEGIFDGLGRMAKAGGKMLKNALDRLLAGVARGLGRAFNALVGAWKRIKPYISQLSESLGRKQKQRLAQIVQAVSSPTAAKVEAFYPVFEEVKDAEDPSALKAKVQLSAPEEAPKNTALNQMAQKLTSDAGIMAIVGVAGVLFGAAFGGLAVGAVALLGLILAAWAILKFLKNYSANSDNQELKQAVDGINDGAVKEMSEEAKEMIVSEIKIDAQEEEVLVLDKAYLTRKGNEAIFELTEDGKRKFTDSSEPYELHTPRGTYVVDEAFAKMVKDKMAKSKGEDYSAWQVSIVILEDRASVPVNAEFTATMNATLKKAFAPAQKKGEEGADADNSPTSSMIRFTNMAANSVKSRQFGEFRDYVVRVQQLGKELAQKAELEGEWDGYMEKIVGLANALAANPSTDLEPYKETIENPGITELTVAAAKKAGKEPGNYTTHLSLREAENNLKAAFKSEPAEEAEGGVDPRVLDAITKSLETAE